MLPTIEKSPIFQAEFSKWREQVSKIQNEDSRKVITQLLNDLLKEVRNIDTQHRSAGGAFNIPSSVGDSREKIISLRKTIAKKIEESTAT